MFECVQQRERRRFRPLFQVVLLVFGGPDYCQWRGRAPSARAQANAILDVHVSKIYVSSRASYGGPRIVQVLRRQGVSVSSERVRQSLCRQTMLRSAPFILAHFSLSRALHVD